MLPEAARALAAVKAAHDAVASAHETVQGQVHVGVGPTIPDGGRMADVLGVFHARHPKVRTHVRQGSGLEHLELVRAGELDLAVCSRPLHPPPGVTLMLLRRTPFVLCVPSEHRLAGSRSVSLQQVADESFIDLRRSWVAREVTDDAFDRLGVDRLVAFEVDDGMLLLQLVERGLGVAVVPGAIRNLPTTAQFIDFDPPVADWHLVVAFMGARPSNVAANVLLGMIAEEWLHADAHDDLTVPSSA